MTHPRYKGKSSVTQRDMLLRYAGPCACCGATIAAGELATYYPPKDGKGRGTVAHVGGLDGNSATCAANIRRCVANYVREGLGE